MLGKIWAIFMRDLRVNLRDFIALYILVFPIIIGVGIVFLVPGVNDTTINLALLEGDNPQQVEYLEQFANIELFSDVDAVNRRLEERDNIVAILPEGDAYFIQTQGNEPASVTRLVSVLNTFHELDVRVEDTTATIETFGRTEPPLKKMLVNGSILLISILGGMMISINIVEEKGDNTVSAINVSPIPRVAFILGKSMMGVLLSVYGSVTLLLITGYNDVNFGQVLLAILAVSVISILIGFIQGLNSEDFMDAAGGIKLLMLPMIAAIAARELLSESWQFVAYWIPFYWTYVGNDAILSYSATWSQILLYTVIVLGISGVVYVVLAPRIQRGLA